MVINIKMFDSLASNRNSKLIIALAIAAVFSAGYFMGQKIHSKNDQKIASDDRNGAEKEMRLSGFNFINPLLECDIFKASMTNSAILSRLKNSIEDLIKKSGYQDSAVYFRDLNNGPWLGVNEETNFTPASLMKVPLMIAVLRNQEIERNLLKKKLAYHAPQVLNQNIGERMNFIDSKEYTIEQFMEYAITYSSNEAAEYLLENVDGEILKKVFHDFNIPDPSAGDEENFMSVRSYASFFRILYNASYLEKNNSEKALEILSQSKFKDGIVAGLPADVPVAHKFGERRYMDDGREVKQLHDCGIVYARNRNYLLCIMTRGDDFDKQKILISDISKAVYAGFVLENK